MAGYGLIAVALYVLAVCYNVRYFNVFVVNTGDTIEMDNCTVLYVIAIISMAVTD